MLYLVWGGSERTGRAGRATEVQSDLLPNPQAFLLTRGMGAGSGAIYQASTATSQEEGQQTRGHLRRREHTRSVCEEERVKTVNPCPFHLEPC